MNKTNALKKFFQKLTGSIPEGIKFSDVLSNGADDVDFGNILSFRSDVTGLPHGSWTKAFFGGDTWMIINRETAAVAVSRDFITWDIHNNTFPSTLDVFEEPSDFIIAYGSGKFVVVNKQTITNTAYISTDAVEWTSITLPRSGCWSSIAYGNGRFVLTHYGFDTGLYSDDGVTWHETFMRELDYESAAYESYISLSYIHDRFIAYCNNDVLYSVDGETWASSRMPKTHQHFCYADGKFIASGAAGISYTSDFSSWAEAEGDIGLASKICCGDNIYVAISEASSPKISISSDGETWTFLVEPTVPFKDIIYADGKFVAFGFGNMAYSTDGSTWNMITAPCLEASIYSNNQCLYYIDSMFVALITEGQINVSTDGINWSDEITQIKTMSGTDVTADIKALLT